MQISHSALLIRLFEVEERTDVNYFKVGTNEMCSFDRSHHKILIIKTCTKTSFGFSLLPMFKC